MATLNLSSHKDTLQIYDIYLYIKIFFLVLCCITNQQYYERGKRPNRYPNQ